MTFWTESTFNTADYRSNYLVIILSLTVQCSHSTLASSAVSRWDEPYRLEKEEALAISYDRIGRQYKSESPFDGLVCDILRSETGTDVASMPGVGYGLSIEPGPVTRERLHTLLPHPSKLVTLRMTGEQVLETLEQSATNLEPDDDMRRVGGLVQTSGIGWTADLNKPIGARVSNVTVGLNVHVSTQRAALSLTRVYAVATNARMLGGLHRCAAFARGSEILTDDRTVTSIVESAMKELGILGSTCARGCSCSV